MWPTEVANRVKFVTPNEFKKATSSPHCFLRYNKNDRLLSIVAAADAAADDNDENNATVLDVIDMDDMIGAKFEIQLLHDDDDSNSYNNNSTHNSHRADNEPLTDQLIDRQGCAVLKLFTYPRRDPSQQTSLIWKICHRWTGNNYNKPKPNPPNYQRPTNPYQTHGNRFQYIRNFVVTPQEDLYPLQTLTAALHELATGRTQQQQQQPSSPTYLVLVNPFSGPKQNAIQLANTIVVPMLEQAGIQTEIVVTNHAGHATELLLLTQQKQQQQPPAAATAAITTNTTNNTDNDNDQMPQKDLLEYDGLVLLGGDGIIHEALNGIFSRTDDVLHVLQDAKAKRIKLGIVGCGTSNGLATSITFHSAEQYGVLDETYLIAKGNTMPIDLSKYETTSKSYIGFMTLSWAMIADIDIESEVLRFLGETRYDLWGVWRVLSLRHYRARLSYLSSSSQDAMTTELPALTEPVPSNWQTIEDNFYVFWAAQVSHASKTNYNSPRSKMQDGVFQILVVRGQISRYRMARILLGLEDGSHENMPGVEWIECTAFRLEPLTEGSFNDLDGEAIESGPIQARVMPSAIQVFGKH